MTMKSLNDWQNAWNSMSGDSIAKVRGMLCMYVHDSQTGVAGFTSPLNWYKTSGGQNTRYLSSKPIQIALERSCDSTSIQQTLGFLYEEINTFYSMRCIELTGISEQDELLHILQVVKNNTGVDYFLLEVEQGKTASLAYHY